MEHLLLLFVGAALVNNIVLSRFLGICPFMGVSKSTETAVGMSLSVAFVMTISAVVSFLIDRYILVPLSLEYLRTIVFILIIVSLVQFVEMFMKKAMPSLYQALGIFLPLITTNCAVLGAAITNIDNQYSLLGSIVYGVFAGVGYLVAIVIFASIRERLEVTAKCPKCFEGFPIALVSASLLAMAFMGFSGLKIW